MLFSLTERAHSTTGAPGPTAPPPVGELLRVLYGLHALIALHLEKEEQIYLPLLDTRLSSAESDELLLSVERTAAEVFGGPSG